MIAQDQTTVSWVESLDKSVMFYGGENNLVLSPIFNPGAQRTPDGAMVVRFADQPWVLDDAAAGSRRR